MYYPIHHIRDIHTATSLRQAKAILRLLNDMARSFESYVSLSENSLNYLFELCRLYPDEYVQTSILELTYITIDMPFGLTTNSPLILFLVDMTNKCDTNSLSLPTRITQAWLSIFLNYTARDMLVELFQQNGDFVQNFLDILRCPEDRTYVPRGFIVPLTPRDDDTNLIACIYFILFKIPEINEIIKQIWPFIIRDDGEIISREDCVSKVQQMNDQEKMPKSAGFKRPLFERPLTLKKPRISH
jgi:hypothetical protein